jgi:hypothetical protein
MSPKQYTLFILAVITITFIYISLPTNVPTNDDIVFIGTKDKNFTDANITVTVSMDGMTDEEIKEMFEAYKRN